MSKVHVLESEGKQYRTVIHMDVPSGNNAVGESWVSCVVHSGSNTTILSVGSGPGQITQGEADDIAAGNVLEFVSHLPIESGGATAASLDRMVDSQIEAVREELQQKFKYFGHSQG